MKYILSFLIIVILTSCGNQTKVSSLPSASVHQARTKKVLVFTKTLGWRHKSIEKGVETIKSIGESQNYIVNHTEDSLLFVNNDLPQYDVIVFLNTTGNVLDQYGQNAFEKYIQAGGSFLGVHSAADTEYDWPWYGKLVGGYFESHPNNPNIREATLFKRNLHSSTSHFRSLFKMSDEWYNYKNLNEKVTPILLLDEKSYEGGTNGDYHPISWYHFYDGGKSFYTGLGHPEEAYNDPLFKRHLEEALKWCLE